MMARFVGNPKVLALVAVVVAAIPGLGMAEPITVDGVRDGNDAYTNSFIANWTNEHHKAGSIYQDGTDETTVFWEVASGISYLFVEVPIWGKNMVWGTGVSAADLAAYDVHNTSLGHHGPLSGIDFGKATGSEKAIFGGITAELSGNTGGTKGGKKGSKKGSKKGGKKGGSDGSNSVSGASGLVSSATSLDFLLDNNICDTTNCAASTTTMSFEFAFDLTGAEFTTLLDSIKNDGIQFHLSPERGLSATVSIPTPATLPMMIFGMALLFAASRCRKRATRVRT